MKGTWLWLAACTAFLGVGAHAGEFPGELVWAQRLELSVPVSGVVAQVRVRPGHVAQTGEVLLELDPTQYQAQVAEAQAEVSRLTEEEADARRELERAQELYARTVTTTTELDASRLRFAKAGALLAAARARLERARWLLSQTSLRAPYPALVLERRAEPGSTVAAQCQPPVLLTIARADEILARAALTPRQAGRLRLGDRAEVFLDGVAYTGQVRAVSYTGTGDKPYVLDVAIARPEGVLAGTPARVRYAGRGTGD